MRPPSRRDISFASGSTSALVDSYGAYVRRLSIGGIPIIKPSKDGIQTHGGIAVLLPYPGRVRDGKYTFEGKAFELPTGKDGHAIHGFAKDALWTTSPLKEDSVSMTASLRGKGYPGVLMATISYSVGARTFSTDCTVRNAGAGDVPVVVGFHPYFLAEEWSIRADSPVYRYGLTDTYFPTGERSRCSLEKAGEAKWDDCFSAEGDITLVARGRELVLRRRNMPYFVLYNGEHAGGESVAVEPYSGLPNAYNNGIGLTILAPGESFLCGYDVALS